MTSQRPRVLLILSGGIAAYKCLEVIRRLRQSGIDTRCVMTRAAEQFVTPLSLQALSEDKVYTDLFSLTDESEMGHIQLSRDADLLVVVPASADILARMAAGMANDLATTVLLATDKPVLVVPAMNVRMWENQATQDNMKTLERRGISVLGPVEGEMACNEFGFGRMVEPDEIVDAIKARINTESVSKQYPLNLTLKGKRILVTSGPTVEPIDPVRFIANRSSGRQGHAIATALQQAGAEVLLVSGPVNIPDPDGVETIKVESAVDMLNACQKQLPVDAAICAAAVADWRVASRGTDKIKKQDGTIPTLELTENPDILATLSQPGSGRPSLVVGFAAETENTVTHATAKRSRKGCDWILANDVSEGTGTFGGDKNRIHFITDGGVEDWPEMSKSDVALELTRRIATHFDLATS